MQEKSQTKRKLVDATYEIIVEKGLEAVTAREVARRVNVTATMIYKHFENLNYLIVVASIRYITDYIEDLQRISTLESNPVEMNLLGWKSFCQFSFRNPPLYEMIFWGAYNDQLEQALFDFYDLFPQEFKMREEAFLVSSLLSGSIEERDFIWLRRGANIGLLDYDDAKFICRTNCLIAHGMLLEHMKDYTDPEAARLAAGECYRLIERNTRAYLKKEL